MSFRFFRGVIFLCSVKGFVQVLSKSGRANQWTVHYDPVCYRLTLSFLKSPLYGALRDPDTFLFAGRINKSIFRSRQRSQSSNPTEDLFSH